MIGIVFIGDLYVCPYLNSYIKQLDAKNVQYDVLFWNRSNEKFCLPDNYIYCNIASLEEQWKVTKLLDFIRFRFWLTKRLRQRKYEKLIILSTLSGMIIPDVLLKYGGKYFFDIRDYSYESHRIFYAIEKRIIDRSFVTAISSPGFQNFLPEHGYVIAHNFQRDELLFQNNMLHKKIRGDTLNLVWNGTMRYFEHQKKIIDRLANDSRFAIYYHGAGPELEQYRAYCHSIDAENVFFTGKYDNADKVKLLKHADIINNSYWLEKEAEIRFAISNRFYDGLIYRIPQLVETGTYKTEICQKYGIGIGLDPSQDDFADLLYDWYFGIDEVRFNTECALMMRKVAADDCIYKRAIEAFIMA